MSEWEIERAAALAALDEQQPEPVVLNEEAEAPAEEPSQVMTDGKPPRIHVRPQTDVDSAVLLHWRAAQKLNPQATLTDSVAWVAQQQQPTAQAADVPSRLDELAADKAMLEAQLTQSINDYDTEAQATATIALISKNAEIAREEMRQKMQEKDQEAARERSNAQIAQESWDAVCVKYPQAAAEGGPMYVAIQKMHEALKEQGNPIVSDPRAVMQIADLVAATVSIPSSQPVKPPAKPLQPRPLPASGGAPVPGTSAIAMQELDSITDPRAFEAWKARNL